MLKDFLRGLLAAPAVVAVLAAPAFAETDDIVVVGQGDRPITVVPRGLSVSLGAEDFGAVNAVNVEDLMRYAPNFFVRKRYIGDANGVPGFRGTHSTQSARTLVMVDGFVVSNFLGNSFSFPPKWGVVGPGEVQQFDIVYGPYSARYPGNSMGGVVSITTRAPQADEAFFNAQVFAQPYEQYGTEATFSGQSLEAGLGWRPNDGPFALRASWRHFENVGQPMSWYQMVPSAAASGTLVTGGVIDPDLVVQAPIYAAESPDQNTQDQVRLRADLDLGRWSVQALGVYWTTQSDRTAPEIYIRDGAGRPVTSGVVSFAGRNWSLNAAPFATTERVEILSGLSASGPLLGFDASVHVSRFWQDKDEARQSNSYDSGASNGAGRLTVQDTPQWTTLDVALERDFGRHAFAFGATLYEYQTGADVFSTTNWRTSEGGVRTNTSGGSTRLQGLWVEDDVQLGAALSLTAGLRLDRWQAFDGRVGRQVGSAFVTQQFPERDETDLNGSLSGQWSFLPGWVGQLSLATATRFPTVGELFQGTLRSDGAFDLNSFDPNLRPERSRDANLLVRRDWGPVRLTGSVFYQHVDDALFRQTGFNPLGVIVSSNQNIDEVRQIGIEAILETQGAFVDGLDADINVAFIDAEILRNRALVASEGKQFPRIPYWRANGTVRYAFNDRWRISSGFRFATRTSNDLTNTQRGDTFGYASEQFIVDARLSWSPVAHAEISFGVDNLTNDRAWAFHPFPQRTFLIEARWLP